MSSILGPNIHVSSQSIYASDTMILISIPISRFRHAVVARYRGSEHVTSYGSDAT
jgi:hypothetical protein